MVMLNGKTYSPSSYVGSPRFTRMEKTKHKTYPVGLRTLRPKRFIPSGLILIETRLKVF